MKYVQNNFFNDPEELLRTIGNMAMLLLLLFTIRLKIKCHAGEGDKNIISYTLAFDAFLLLLLLFFFLIGACLCFFIVFVRRKIVSFH